MLAAFVAQWNQKHRIPGGSLLTPIVACVGILLLSTFAAACPFCAAPARTLSEDLAASDVVAFAKLVAKGNVEDNAVATTDGRGESTFEITTLIKGDAFLGKEKELKAFYFGDAKPGAEFFITGMALPEVKWNTPIPITSRGKKYLSGLPELPEAGPERLAFFWGYLEDEEPLLAQDAYDEFARAPYKDVIALKDTLNRKQLIDWINSPDLAQSRRRLYFTLLGVCGKPEDVPMLEDMMQSSDRRRKAGLDALIGCYLALKGADGMPLVEDLYLKKKDAEYSDTYAAIMSIRVMGQESDVVPRERLLEALRYMLDRPDLADLVIPDLARWEDWAVMDRMVNLFKNANAKSNFVRVPVINYLEAAARKKGPVGEKAKAAIDELEKIDPEAVKRAKAYAIFGPLAAPKPGSNSGSDDASDKQEGEEKSGADPVKEKKTGAALAPALEVLQAMAISDSDTAGETENPEDLTALLTLANDSAETFVETREKESTSRPKVAEADRLQPVTPVVAQVGPMGDWRTFWMVGMIVTALIGVRVVTNRMKVAE